MNVKQTLSKYLDQITPTMHKTRRQSLFAVIESTVNGAVLSESKESESKGSESKGSINQRGQSYLLIKGVRV